MKNDVSTSVSAPGSVVLFGDFAVNFGQPAVGLALDVRYKCDASISNKFTVNDEELDGNRYPWIRGALIQGWTDMDTPIALRTHTAIPTGLGESGARTVACLGALSMLHNHLIFEEVARKAYEVNNEVREFSNPLDVAVSTHGSGIFITPEKTDNHIWALDDAEPPWSVHLLALPETGLVIGTADNHAPGNVEAKVRRFYETNAFARDLIEDIGLASVDGAKAMANKDVEKVGRIMTTNQKLLVNLGVCGKEMDRLCTAMSRHSYGAKVTCGGGCVIALTDNEEEVARAVERAGFRTHCVSLSVDGIKLEDETD